MPNKITEIYIYNNAQDPANEECAYSYCFHSRGQPAGSGPIGGKEEGLRDLIAAIEEAIEKAGLYLTADDFAITWPGWPEDGAAHWVESHINFKETRRACARTASRGGEKSCP